MPNFRSNICIESPGLLVKSGHYHCPIGENQLLAAAFCGLVLESTKLLDEVDLELGNRLVLLVGVKAAEGVFEERLVRRGGESELLRGAARTAEGGEVRIRGWVKPVLIRTKRTYGFVVV